MKNLKKVLALVVALTMVLGTVSFAFTDVESDSDVYTAVQTLSSLNILNGYEDGTFGAEKDITRAEFAAVVCRALGMESSAKGAAGATQFTDVAADHWASGYINLAAGQGIVNGYGDGKFGPEDNVTYEQAVKMLVVALGFEPMAAQKGGYPTGYLVIANQYGMTKGVSAQGASANRGTVAQLTFNALDIPMMTQTGWGTNTEYTVQDGQNNNGYKTLLTVLEVEKLDGIVTATPTIGGSTTDEKITYKITNIDAEKSAFNLGNANLYVAEGINVNDYFGMASTVYAKEFKKGRFEIIAIMPGEASETVEFLAEDMDSITATEIKYFESDAATKATKVDLAAGINRAVYLNNKLETVTDLNATLTSWKTNNPDTVITLYENDDTAPGYDMIVAKRYTHDIVKEVEVAKDRIELKNEANAFRFDFEDSTKINNLYDKDGNEITLEDFAEGDVIAYITENGTLNGFDWCEVINLGQNKVTGKVTELDEHNSKVAIDGVVYDYYKNMDSIPAISDEGDFYLRLDGTIFHKDTTASISSNYAYILDAEWNANDVFNPGWQIKLLTKNDGIQVYSMKDSFTVTDLTGTKTTHSKSSNVPSTTVPAQFAAAKVDCDTSTTEDAEERLVTFKLDSNNTIREIIFIKAANQLRFLDGTGAEYNDAAQKLKGGYIADKAVVFNVADASADNAEVLTVDSLVDEAKYKGLLAKADASEDEYNCVVLTYGAATVDYTQPIAVVSSKATSVDADGGTVVKLTYYTTDDEEAKELIIDDDTKVSRDGDTDRDKIAKGDIIMFTANDKGVASYVDVLAKVKSDVYELTSEVDKAIEKENDNEFIVGYINNMRTGSKGKVIEYAGATHKEYSGGTVASGDPTGEVVITSDVYGFTYVNNHSDKGYIAAGDWSADPDIDKPNGALKTYFFARVLDGVLTDIVVLGDQK